MKIELLPCPFCGSDGEHDLNVKSGWGVYCIQCKCGVSGSSWGSTTDAAKAWNERAERPPNAAYPTDDEEVEQ